MGQTVKTVYEVINELRADLYKFRTFQRSNITQNFKKMYIFFLNC
jgi:hypothetical protein